jgi:hypothetical protein
MTHDVDRAGVTGHSGGESCEQAGGGNMMLVNLTCVSTPAHSEMMNQANNLDDAKDFAAFTDRDLIT